MEQGKRKLKRIRLICSLEVFDRVSGERLGLVEDITVEGMRVKGPSLLETNRMIPVRLQLPSEIEGRLDVGLDARCTWARPSDTPGLFEVGLQFVDAPSDAIEILDMLIRRFQR